MRYIGTPENLGREAGWWLGQGADGLERPAPARGTSASASPRRRRPRSGGSWRSRAALRSCSCISEAVVVGLPGAMCPCLSRRADARRHGDAHFHARRAEGRARPEGGRPRPGVAETTDDRRELSLPPDEPANGRQTYRVRLPAAWTAGALLPTRQDRARDRDGTVLPTYDRRFRRGESTDRITGIAAAMRAREMIVGGSETREQHRVFDEPLMTAALAAPVLRSEGPAATWPTPVARVRAAVGTRSLWTARLRAESPARDA